MLVLMPLLIGLMLGQNTGAFVALTTVINVLNELDAAADFRVALARLAAAVLAAVLAIIVQQFVLTSDTMIIFFLAVFVPCLWLAPYILRGGMSAITYSLGLSTYVLLLGIAVTPLPGGSEESAELRVLRVAVSGMYALGLINLLGRVRTRLAAAR